MFRRIKSTVVWKDKIRSWLEAYFYGCLEGKKQLARRMFLRLFRRIKNRWPEEYFYGCLEGKKAAI